MPVAVDNGDRLQMGHVITIALFTCAAFMANGVFPVLVDPLIAEGRASLAQVGRIATADYLVTGIVSLAAPRLFRVDRFRQISVIAAVLLVLGNLLSIQLRGDALLIGRVIAGLGGGVLIWLQYAYVARSRHAELLTGCFLASFVVLSTLVVYLAPIAILPHFGAGGIYLVIALTACAAGLSALMVPRDILANGVGPSTAGSSRGPIPIAALCILGSVFFFTAYLASVWVYLGPIATANALSPSVLERATIGSLIMQAVGAAGAGVIYRWVASRWALALLLVTAVVESFFLTVGHVGPAAFLIVALTLGAIGNAVMPFAIGLLGEFDRGRRSIEFISAPLILGGGFGPMMASLAVGASDIDRGNLLSFIWSAIALLLFVVALAIGRRPIESTSYARDYP